MEGTLFVRQRVATDIRPAPPQPVRPAPAPGDDTGWAVFNGRTGQVIELDYTYSASYSLSAGQEQERLVDQVRVYQQEDPPGSPPGTPGGDINRDNYIDVDVPKQIAMTDSATGEQTLYKYAPPATPDNVDVLQTDVKQKNPDYVAPPPPSGSSGAPLRRQINRRPRR